MSARHLQARQGKQHDQLQRILCQPAKAHVGLANLLLDHPELPLGHDLRLIEVRGCAGEGGGEQEKGKG